RKEGLSAAHQRRDPRGGAALGRRRVAQPQRADRVRASRRAAQGRTPEAAGWKGRHPGRQVTAEPIEQGDSMNALKQWVLLLALARTAAFPFLARAQDARDPVAVATALLDAMDARDYAAAEAAFTAEMAAAVPADRLQAVWESLPAQAGVATGRGEPQVARMGDTAVVSIPLHHAGAELVAKVAVDAQGKVAGFVIQPATAPAPAAPADNAGFSEQELSIGEGDAALPATLALPAGEGPFPAVVLVHGSGPHDRNETTGPNRPFLDIARGLAAQGVAVLRYEKRSKAHPEAYVAPGSLTIDSE